jgi:hypothetical protein
MSLTVTLTKPLLVTEVGVPKQNLATAGACRRLTGAGGGTAFVAEPNSTAAAVQAVSPINRSDVLFILFHFEAGWHRLDHLSSRLPAAMRSRRNGSLPAK